MAWLVRYPLTPPRQPFTNPFLLPPSLFLCLVFAGTAAGQFTLSGYACKECPLFVLAVGPQPSSPFKT